MNGHLGEKQTLFPNKDKKVREYIEYLRKKYPPRKKEERL